MTLAVACFALVMAAIILHSTPRPLGSGVFEDQHAETAVYLVAFGLILPAALILVPRLADAIAAGPNAGALSLLAALLAATLALSIIVVSVLPGGGGLVDELAVVGAWSIGAGAVLVRATRPRRWTGLIRIARLAPFAWASAAALVLAALLAFTSIGSISPVALGLGAILVPLALLVYVRRDGVGLVRVPRRWGLAIDAAVILLLLLAIPDLVIFGSALGAIPQALDTSIIQFHQDLWLGPVNEVLAGHALLVDNASQYGVGPIYLAAAWFQLAPIGYGTFGFLDGALSALLFAAGYSVLRLAGTPRLLAAGAMALGVIVLVYNLVFSVGTIPQHGPLRFGLPIILILAAVAEARWPRRATAAWAAQLVVLGVASIWALEALAYTAATFAAIVVFQAWTRAGRGRLRWLAGRAALALAACVAANLILAALTLAFAGRLPDYGQYYDYLHEFLFGVQSIFTFDYSHWSPGLPAGVAYAASAAAFILVVRRRREVVEAERVTFTALCGVSAYGVVLYTYFVDRSEDLVLPYVSLPALLAGTLWLSLLLRGALTSSRRSRVAGLAFALALSVLLVGVAWSSVGTRFQQSALGYIVPGDGSLGGALHGLWNPPPLDARSPDAERLLDRYMPGQRRVLIFVSPALGTETLMRSGRSNALPFTDPVEDSNDGFLGIKRIPALRRGIARLEAGDRMLMQRGGLKAFATLQRQPSRDVFFDPVSLHQPPPQGLAGPQREQTTPSESLTQLQQWALQQIAQRFDLRVLDRDAQGFVVAELEPRRSRAG